MISKDEVKHIAKLARLELSDKEIVKMEQELSLILDYMEKLNEVDVSQVDLKKALAETKSVLREDEAIPQSIERIAKLLDSVPQKKNNYLKTKKIL